MSKSSQEPRFEPRRRHESDSRDQREGRQGARGYGDSDAKRRRHVEDSQHARWQARCVSFPLSCFGDLEPEGENDIIVRKGANWPMVWLSFAECARKCNCHCFPGACRHRHDSDDYERQETRGHQDRTSRPRQPSNFSNADPASVGMCLKLLMAAKS